MFLIVGLGNPGEEYEHTRHNAGFEVVDRLAEEAHVNYWKNACGSLVGEGRLPLGGGKYEDVVLAKPQSFMNLSGGPVAKLLKQYAIAPDQWIVVHDELDIPAGSVRVKRGGGHAGHNGLRSIIDKAGTRDFLRVRVGVGRPPGRMPVPDFVLQVPRKDAMDDFVAACDRGAEAAKSLIAVGLEKSQQVYNQR
ncbi:MAG: aminoacyl-tRNA hydrolase [Coriobacteriia bacterium]|nr:aminoacyl-tRNA hydrolase [Coriobacteriia bacterium]